MAKDDVIVFTGTVEDKLPNTMFRVKLENGHEILATVCGKMRKARIWVNIGERVRVEMTPYDLDKGRITFVERNRPSTDTANYFIRHLADFLLKIHFIFLVHKFIF